MIEYLRNEESDGHKKHGSAIPETVLSLPTELKYSHQFTGQNPTVIARAPVLKLPSTDQGINLAKDWPINILECFVTKLLTFDS